MRDCDSNEDVDHLFVKCDFDRIWYLISDWVEFVTVTPGILSDQFMHFIFIGGFSKKEKFSTLNVIWLSSVWVI